MNSRMYGDWFGVGVDAWMLGAEASVVVGLRTMRLAAGGDAGRKEAALMVTEKIGAAMELQASLMGATPTLTPLSGTLKTLQHYRSKVAANRRRLSR